jgi:hypothetical protein
MCILRAFFIALLVTVTGCFWRPAPGAEFIGTQAPPARFTLMNGMPVALDSFRGKTVVLAFWELKCPGSSSVLKALKDFAADFENRPAVEFIAPNLDKAEHRAAVEKRIAELDSKKITYTFSGNDVDDEAFRLFHGEFVPYVLVINPKGEVTAAGDSASVFRRSVH